MLCSRCIRAEKRQRPPGAFAPVLLSYPLEAFSKDISVCMYGSPWCTSFILVSYVSVVHFRSHCLPVPLSFLNTGVAYDQAKHGHIIMSTPPRVLFLLTNEGMYLPSVMRIVYSFLKSSYAGRMSKSRVPYVLRTQQRACLLQGVFA